jgi:hypothetical protein
VAYKNRLGAGSKKFRGAALGIGSLDLLTAVGAVEVGVFPVDIDSNDIPAVSASCGSYHFSLSSAARFAKASPVTGDGEQWVAAGPGVRGAAELIS